MPKSTDKRPKRKVTVMLPVAELETIQGQTNETDTRLMLRLVEQEAQRMRDGKGDTPRLTMSGTKADMASMRFMVTEVLREYKLLPPDEHATFTISEVKPKPAKKRTK